MAQFVDPRPPPAALTPAHLLQTESQLMTKLSDLLTVLTSISDTMKSTGTQLEKGLAEIKSGLAEVELPPAVDAKLTELLTLASGLKKSAQQIDDLTPDQPTTTP